MKKLVIAIVCLIGGWALSDAPTVGEFIETELVRLSGGSPKAYSGLLTDFYEKKVERLYQQRLREAKDDEVKQALVAAQDAWQRYYDAERVVGALGYQGGSGAVGFGNDRKIWFLKIRMQQLTNDYMDGWEADRNVQDVGVFQKPGPVYHRVDKGETLSGIARLYELSVEELVELNSLKKPDVIVDGRRILIKESSVPIPDFRELERQRRDGNPYDWNKDFAEMKYSVKTHDINKPIEKSPGRGR